MKQKILLLVTVVLLSMTSVFAQSGTTGPLTWVFEDGTLTISGEGEMPDYRQMDYYGDYAPWNEYREFIYTAIIEPGVTCIGNYAFFFCENMTSISIPNTVTSIHDRSFDMCRSLISADIPNSVTYIGGGAFYCCVSLSSVNIPNSVTRIGDLAFYFCTSLTSITIPNSITSMGYSVFSFCTGLTSSVISDGITWIADGLFSYCTSLTSVTIPNSVTSIYDGAFAYCTSLTSISLPASITWFGWGAFYYCVNLTSITNFNPVPVAIYSDVFYCVPQRITTLKVPIGAISAYKDAENWKNFHIVGISEEELDIEPHESDIIKIYPNPTAGELQITNYELRIENVEIFDVVGKCVATAAVKTGRTSSLPITLDISHLPSGVYFVRLQTDKGLITKKIVKK